MRRIYRFLFSRYAISLFFILFEIALFVPSFWLYEIPTVVIVLSFVVAMASIISLINRNVNPEYKVTWLIVIVFLPYVGTALYIIFSRRRIYRKEGKIFSEIVPRIANPEDAISREEKIAEITSSSPSAATKFRAIINDDYLAEVSTATRVKYFPSGEELYSDMLTSLSGAKKFIFLEYFIIEPGEMWNGIYEILKEKAALGVEVRVLYDDVGCMGRLPRGFDRMLAKDGIRAARFGKITPKATVAHNNRDHRKLMIIDGRVAYTGGVNIADEYINKRVRFGHWKDGGVSVLGRAVAPMLTLFLTAWDITCGGVIEYKSYLDGVAAVEGDGGYYVPFAGGPMPIYKRPVPKRVFLNIINQAERSVYITTPYLVIDFDLTEALRSASMRGVDVRIITPGVADKKTVKIMTKSSYRYLMDAGVRIYEYPGFIHEKLVMSDGAYAVFGTVNFDYRSLVHHYENAILAYASSAVEDAEKEFLRCCKVSRAVDVSGARLGPFEWLIKIFIRVFAPLL